jgi:predicted aspartyl protease
MRLAAASLLGAVLSELLGHVDARNRPLLTFSVPGREDGVLGLVDTGFNGYLLVDAAIAQQLGFTVTDVTDTVEFAGHVHRRLSVAAGRIHWFDQVIDIDVLVSAEEPPRMAAAEPAALIGTTLLNPHSLTVDFATRRVVLSEGA